MKYFQVKIGFGRDEYISITENELPMAIRAQLTGKTGIFNEGTVNGSRIISIVPDFNRAMGWNRDYQLNGEDYAEIGKKRVGEYRVLLTDTKDTILKQIHKIEPVKKIGS